jgi:hypothetical protein
MNIEILDGCRDASFRKLGGIAPEVALFDAPQGKFIAGAAPPINSSNVLEPSQAYFQKYQLASFTRPACKQCEPLDS